MQKQGLVLLPFMMNFWHCTEGPQPVTPRNMRFSKTVVNGCTAGFELSNALTQHVSNCATLARQERSQQDSKQNIHEVVKPRQVIRDE